MAQVKMTNLMIKKWTMHFTLLGKKKKGKQQKGRTQAKVVSQKSG